jgi:hypothetical protein
MVNVTGPTVSVYISGNLVGTFTDAWLPSGRIGVGLDGQSAANSYAQFSAFNLGGSPAVVTTTTTSTCYDQWGNAVPCNCVSYSSYCNCFNGTVYYNCNNCNGINNCGYCNFVYGNPAPCQCFDPWGHPVSCSCYDTNGQFNTSCNCFNGQQFNCQCHDGQFNNFCGCHDGNQFNDFCQCHFDRHDGHDDVDFDHKGNDFWKNHIFPTMNSKCMQTPIDICDGIWVQTPDGYKEVCY